MDTLGMYLILTSFVSTVTPQQNLISYYENLINEEIDKSINYKFPEDASEHKPNTGNPTQDYGTFDFIIVGAGSTGATIANRLSEIKKWSILLVEAGKFGNNFTDMPNMQTSYRLSEYNWGFKTVPQKTACLDVVDQRCVLDRGKGVGGSFLINIIAYTRGNHAVYNKWARIVNDSTWSYKKILPYFKKSENFVKTNADAAADFQYHGRNGPLNVENHVPTDERTKIFLKANQKLGYKILDFNGKTQMGVGLHQLNAKNGKRQDTGTVFIKPIRSRKNFKVLTESYVTKLLIGKDKIARGVEFTHGGNLCIAKARKEVILSAGVINTPQILMLSGIGPRKHLEEVGIEVIEDLEVGSRLLDHPAVFGISFTSNFTDNSEKSLKGVIKDYINGTGWMTDILNNQAIGYYNTKNRHSTVPNVELSFSPLYGYTSTLNKRLSSAKEKGFQHLEGPQSFSVMVMDVNAKSSGSIRLKSNNSFDYPLIDLKLLSEPEDVETLYEGIQLVFKLIKTKPFQEINSKHQKQPIKACDSFEYLSKDYWYCIIRHLSSDVYHPMGTCPMGVSSKDGAVVSNEAKVFGISKLRIADASIFPVSISAHPNAACIMVGEKISDVIKNEHLKRNQ